MDPLTNGKYIIDSFFPFVVPHCGTDMRHRGELAKIHNHVYVNTGSQRDMKHLLDLCAVLKYLMNLLPFPDVAPGAVSRKSHFLVLSQITVRYVTAVSKPATVNKFILPFIPLG